MSENAKYQKEVSYKDIGTILLEERIINLVGPVDDVMAYQITSALLVLDKDNQKPIQLLINSPGGSISAGLDIIDTMNFIKSPVYTIVKGMAASMGAAILSAGQKGHRMALPNATVMLHQASSNTGGNIQDQIVDLEYTKKLNDRLMEIIAKNCGKTSKQIKADTIRDHWMFAEDALKYGIVDEVVKVTEKKE
jgi:ATP-dependent Clp protease protease subunit